MGLWGEGKICRIARDALFTSYTYIPLDFLVVKLCYFIKEKNPQNLKKKILGIAITKNSLLTGTTEQRYEVGRITHESPSLPGPEVYTAKCMPRLWCS